jgi:hypothetical protein
VSLRCICIRPAAGNEWHNQPEAIANPNNSPALGRNHRNGKKVKVRTPTTLLLCGVYRDLSISKRATSLQPSGGTRPAGPGDSAPPGSQIGENGIFGRPENRRSGSSIDIPANGDKPHETLHYPSKEQNKQ